MLRLLNPAVPVVLLFAAAAQADGYLTDSSGSVVQNSYGECVHTSYWEPENAVVGCDNVIAKVEVLAEPVEFAVVEPAPMVEQITLDAATYFEFDKARLKPAAKDKLDAVIQTAGNYDDLVQVRISGHTDPIGTEAYNQRLALRRAEAVRQYLIDRGPIDPDRLTVVSRGESDPLVRCEGLQRQELIDCFAPNRRVELGIQAT